MSEYSKYTYDCVAFLQKLIQTPSVNGRDNESRVVEVIAQEAEKLQLPYKVIAKDQNRPNIFVGNNFQSSNDLLLVAHTDTVPEGNQDSWEHPPFSGTIQYGKLFGRGAIDCKGGIAVSLYTLKALSDMGKLNRGKFVGVADEESGADSKLGLTHLLEEGLKAKEAIYTYGDDERWKRLTIGHRGVIRLWIECLGEDIHSGSREWQDRRKGESAIDGLVDFLTNVRGYNQPGEHKLFPGLHFTLTPTMISGGSGESIVPAEAKVLLDIRTLPEHSNEQIIEDIRGMTEELTQGKRKFNVTIKNNVLGALTDPNADIVKRAQRLVNEIEGRVPNLGGSGPANEGYMLIKRGIPTIMGFGPIGDNFHSAGEYASIESIEDSLMILTRLASE